MGLYRLCFNTFVFNLPENSRYQLNNYQVVEFAQSEWGKKEVRRVYLGSLNK